MSHRRRTAGYHTCVFGVFLLACGEAPAQVAEANRPFEGGGRRISEDSLWVEHHVLGGPLDDSTLLIPIHPVVRRNGIYIADLGADRVSRYTHDGDLVWSVGRTGAGPGEFLAPRGLGVAADGRVWVADQGTGRITVISADGDIEFMVTPKVEGAVNEIVPLSDSTAILTLVGPARPFAHIAADGRVLKTFPFPWVRFADLHPLVNQFLTGVDPRGEDDWVAAFRVGDGFFRFRGTTHKAPRGWFVEEVPFPQPQVKKEGNTTTTFFREQPTASALSLTLSPTSIYVLFGGTSEHRGRIVDRYARSDGSYVESIILPGAVSDITWFDGGFFVLHQRPYPTLTYLTRASELP